MVLDYQVAFFCRFFLWCRDWCHLWRLHESTRLIAARLYHELNHFSMAGYFAGIGKAPFTAILLVTEMVGNLTHLMPLAVPIINCLSRG